MEDKRPDPRPRKHPQLYQSWWWWDRLIRTRTAGTNRISSIEAGKCMFDLEFEQTMLDALAIDANIEFVKKTMINHGVLLGDVWTWITSIRGLAAGSLAAQLLAQIDYPAPFPGSYPEHCGTVSKLWRFAGWGVNGDGQIDRPTPGERLPYNKRLKSTCWLCVDQFIKQQTPVYVELYYAEKERQRRLHPEKIKVNGKWKYNDGHLHNMAIRKVAKVFLQHVWLVWRESEGLPTGKPWVHEHGGHTHYILPPNWPLEPGDA